MVPDSDSLLKYKKNNWWILDKSTHRWRKMDCLQQYDAKKVLRKINELLLTTSKASLHLKNILCIWWDYKDIVYLELLLQKSGIEFRQVLFPVKPIKKVAIDEKHSDVANQNVFLIRTKPDLASLCRPGKTYYNLIGIS